MLMFYYYFLAIFFVNPEQTDKWLKKDSQAIFKSLEKDL